MKKLLLKLAAFIIEKCANYPRIGYMDKTDFEHEVGEALGGNKIYCSAEDLLENEPCAETCGIVKVKLSLIEVVKERKRC